MSQKHVQRNWPVAYRWLAMGTLVMYTAVGAKVVTPASAQGIPSDARSAVPARRFQIPAGPLETVLGTFRTLTGIAIEMNSDGIAMLSSPGVNGMYTVDAGLKQLLTGTGVSYRFVLSDKVLLELRGPNASIEVAETLAPASPKYSQPLRDIPQTITIIPKAMIEQQAATSLRDVLRNVPGLTMTAGEGGVPSGDNLTLRGFSARNDVFVDGVRDLGPQSRDPFNMEQVEVVKGPSSAFAGRGSTGGTINLISKAPALSRFFGGSFNLGSDDTKRVTGDVNLPVADRAAFRLNFMAHESGVAGRDVVRSQRSGVAPSMALGLGTPTRLALSYFRLKQDNVPDYGIPWVTATHNVLSAYRDQPAPVDRSNYYGLRSRDYERTGSDMGTVRVEHDFSDTFTLRSQLRYGVSTRNSLTTAPRFASNDSLTINRNGPSWITRDGIWDNQNDITARVKTGSIEHSLATGFSLTSEKNRRTGVTVAGTPATTLHNPDPDQVFTGTITANPILGRLAADSQAMYLFDTAKVGERWQLTGGVRWERFDVDGTSTAGAPLAKVDRMASVRGGVVYKPASSGTLYVSYGTSLNPSLEGLSYQPATVTVEPEKTYTVEAGTKWDLFGTKLLLTGSVFRVEKTNARTPGVLPDDPPQVLEGAQRVNGFEIGATGSITRQWKVFGGYSFLDSRVLHSNVAFEVGRRIQNTPKNSLNVWSTYRLRKLEVGGGPRFIDSRYGNAINTRKVGSYWTADAMASYDVTRKFSLRLNLFNLNNAFYFDRLAGGHLVPGAARSAMVSTAFRF